MDYKNWVCYVRLFGRAVFGRIGVPSPFDAFTIGPIILDTHSSQHFLDTIGPHLVSKGQVLLAIETSTSLR